MNVIYNERLENIPKILETPYIDREYPPYKQEIEMIRNKRINPNLYTDILQSLWFQFLFRLLEIFWT